MPSSIPTGWTCSPTLASSGIAPHSFQPVRGTITMLVFVLPSSSGLGRLPPQVRNACSNHAGNANISLFPSSSGLGRLPPQVRNGGSNPSGNANLVETCYAY